MTFLVMSSIPVIVMVIVVMYSKIGEVVLGYVRRATLWLLYDSTKPRRWIWTRFYEFLSWVYPEDAFYIMNSGYALLSQDGLMKKFTPLDHEAKEIYQYQLYHAVANMVGKNAISGKRIVDLSCGRGGGTFFLYSLFKPKKIYGVDNACYHIKSCRETFMEEEQKTLIRERKKINRMIEKRNSMSESAFKGSENEMRGRTQSVSVSFNRKDKIDCSPQNREFLHKREEDLAEETSADSLLQKLDEMCELEYIIGEAETLHTVLPVNSIDCMFCIESSKCYGNLDNFFKSAHTVLKTPPEDCKEPESGILLYADCFEVHKLAKVKECFLDYFDIVKQENITSNVFQALEIDGENRRNRIYNSVDFCFRAINRKFSNMLDASLIDDLQNKKKCYYMFVLKKKVVDDEFNFFELD